MRPVVVGSIDEEATLKIGKRTVCEKGLINNEPKSSRELGERERDRDYSRSLHRTLLCNRRRCNSSKHSASPTRAFAARCSLLSIDLHPLSSSLNDNERENSPVADNR